MPAPQEPVGTEDAEAEARCRSRGGRTDAGGGPNYYRRNQHRLNVDGKAFGSRVRALRQDRGWSLEELRDASGVPLMTLSNLENGKTDAPNPALTMALAETFGFATPVGLLTGREPDAGAAAGPGPTATRSALGREAAEVLAGLLAGLWETQEARGERRGRVTRLVALTVGVAEILDDPAPASSQAPSHDPHTPPPPGPTP
jgi:transcriptional regulator with XRE-family HTH domain